MARRPRADSPGSWHHVINRAIAKRPYFEARSDKRYFLARLATEVRAGRLEVHAYCLMTTHFHLLVRSPVGELSEAMRRAQCAYSRHFNRRRRRDGPLIRARFFSKRIDSESYRRAVVRYIDANPVRAGIVRAPEQHEFGSARSFLAVSPPPWLSTGWIREHSVKRSGAARFSGSAYRRTFGPCDSEDPESLREMIESRMASTSELDPLDDLIGATPDQVRQWMIRKARLADGMKVGLPVCGMSALRRALDRHVEAHGQWVVGSGPRTWRGAEIAWPGLLRDLCSMPISRIAPLCGATDWMATRYIALHHAWIEEGGDYAMSVSEISQEALSTTILG